MASPYNVASARTQTFRWLLGNRERKSRDGREGDGGSGDGHGRVFLHYVTVVIGFVVEAPNGRDVG